MARLFSVFVIALAAVGTATHGLAQGPALTGSSMLVYVGTYTGPKSKGIYVSRLDTENGTLSPAELAAETTSPSFLAVHPNEKYLYAVNETNTFTDETGGVSAFAIDRATGKLQALGTQSSEGAGPAHLTVDKSGRNVLVANYGGGSVAVLPINAKDGKLKSGSALMQHKGHSVNQSRQSEPHAHSITTDPSGRFVYVADLGLDWIVIYQLDERKGLLTLNEPPNAKVEPGAGPRHFSVHPSGRFGYVINELNCTLTAFTRDANYGGLTQLHTVSALPSTVQMQQGFSGAELEIHPSGRYLYTSIRGHNSISVFTIDQNSGRLTYVDNTPTQGNTPRGFGIDPQGKYLVAGNQNSDNVVVFRIDSSTGKLTPTGSKIDIGSPVSFKFVK
ncbi:MAG TPA: lactonase family protein [Vicinamibacterales bacterium]|nr:lactonase family protein [Vicinamibacterales bacterium]